MAIRSKQSGLTLVEVIVVLAIFGLVSGVLFFNFNDFNTNITLRNLSQETALAIRKAQTYATGVHNLSGTSQSSLAYSSYGISFSVDENNTDFAPNPKRFVIFVDYGSGNRIYNNNGNCTSPAANSECVEAFTINTPEKIARLCTQDGCITSGTANVVFTRPSPDAEICIVSGSSCVPNKSFLRVEIESVRGGTRSVTVWNTGQISVE